MGHPELPSPCMKGASPALLQKPREEVEKEQHLMRLPGLHRSEAAMPPVTSPPGCASFPLVVVRVAFGRSTRS